MKPSLGNRLLLILLVVTLLVWVPVSAVVWMLGTAAFERQIDNQLRTLVSTVSYTIDAFITAGYDGGPAISLMDFEVIRSSEGSVYTVDIPDTALPISLNVWAGDALRATTLGSPIFKPLHQSGIDNELLEDGSQWRVIRSRLGDTDLWLVAGLSEKVLAADSKRLLFAALSPLLIGLLLMVPLTYYAVRNGLKPLRALEQQISQRSSSDLQAVATDGIPVEVAPVVNALNGLLQKLGIAIEKEKNLTADAAHELQTPLAAIKTEAQLALSHTKGDNASPLLRIIERVNRASHAVKQLTTLSRLESTAEAFSETVQLHALIDQLQETYAEELTARHLTLSVTASSAVVCGSADMLQILIDNLLRNALNYALQETEIIVTLSTSRATILRIENECGQLSEQDWQQITQRFYRVPGSRGTGSGLGMSIAQRICALHGAKFSVGRRTSGEGFSVSIEFPRNC